MPTPAAREPDRSWLLLDASTPRAVVAVAVPGRALIPLEAESRHHARGLAPLVAEALARSGLAARELQAIGVGLGPGSFTGLRVAVALAKTLAYATGARIAGLHTFEAIARDPAAAAGLVAVVADAQRGDWAVERFRRSDTGVLSRAALRVEPAEAVLAALEPDELLAGPALIRLGELDRARLGPALAPEASWLPGAPGLLAAALERAAVGRWDDPMTLAPLYSRRSAAEEKADAATPGPP
jgi:tRNA threonylcarbamoyladenosine biosynthesis protein TsaB